MNPLHKLLVKSMPKTIGGRRRYIRKKLSPFANMEFACPALGKNAVVKIVAKTIKETSFNASLSEQSTLLAKNLPVLFRNAKVIEHDPDVQKNKYKYSKTFNNMNFSEGFVLKSTHNLYGTAKIVVGQRNKGKYTHYCVTALYIKR